MYEYIYEKGKNNSKTFILLHGTGGDERNLIPVAQAIDVDANILSIRGNVSENGMNRYFKRHGEGHYDWEDLEKRGKELYQFIEDLSEKHGFSLEDGIYLGFSNGSNIAMNMLLLEENRIDKGMLFAPMYPKELETKNDLSSRKVYLSMGENDPIVPLEESKRVINHFTSQHAKVTEFWVNSHELNEQTLVAAKKWYEELEK